MRAPAPPSALARMGVPIVAAPMAGGPSRPELAAAVSDAGGLGFLAGGYLTPEALREQIAATRARTVRDIGVNLFVDGSPPADPAVVGRYAERLAPMAGDAGASLGTPRHDDDHLVDKLELVIAQRIPVVSFTFGLPAPSAVDDLHAAGVEVWITVTSPDEAEEAARRGADALVVQGIEAGGHRATFADDDGAPQLGLLVALQLIAAVSERPLVASGGLMTGAAVAAVLTAGAQAAQLGTAYLRSAEAGTSDVHRAAVAGDAPTALTRAFSGRTARTIVNHWHTEHAAAAPRAYPEVHHLTAPLRAHGRAAGDPDLVNLWAGEGHALAREAPAAQITEHIAAEARAAVSR